MHICQTYLVHFRSLIHLWVESRREMVFTLNRSGLETTLKILTNVTSTSSPQLEYMLFSLMPFSLSLSK